MINSKVSVKQNKSVPYLEATFVPATAHARYGCNANGTYQRQSNYHLIGAFWKYKKKYKKKNEKKKKYI